MNELEFVQHYSGSAGNLYTVESVNGRRLVIECGVRWPKMLEALGYQLDNVDGCLLSHEHKTDHAKAVDDVIGSGVQMYMSEGTRDALGLNVNPFVTTVPKDKCYDLSDTFMVLPFFVHHDAADPVGWLIYEKPTKEWLYFSVDSSHLTNQFNRREFSIIAIEVNYDIRLLEWNLDNGFVHQELAKRILYYHAEKETTAEYIRRFLPLKKCREIHLLHCSEGNLDKAGAVKEFERKFFVPIKVKGVNV